MADNPRLAADSREVVSRLRTPHRTANRIAERAVRDGKPKAVVDTIRAAETIADEVIKALTADDLRAT